VPDFYFHVGPRVWIGPDALLRLPLLAAELAGQGRARAVLVADPMLYESKTVDRVRGLLEDRDVQVLVFDELPERASSRAADDALRLTRGARAPLIIGLGGLKTMMIARTVATLGASTVDVDGFLDGAEVRSTALPLIEVPTSLRHGFMTDTIVLLPDGRDRRIRLVRASGASPSAVLVDPLLSAGLSPKVGASCAIDGLLGAVEAYVSSKASFMSDLLLERAAQALAAGLDGLIARPDDPSARSEVWRGSFLASLGAGLSSPGIGTALTFAINSRWPVPKASLAAILLPYSLESASKSRLEKIARLAGLFGEDSAQLSDVDAASKAVEWLRTRLGQLKIPSRLKDFDLTLDRLVETARDARELDFMNYLPRAVSVDDVFDFIKMAF